MALKPMARSIAVRTALGKKAQSPLSISSDTHNGRYNDLTPDLMEHRANPTSGGETHAYRASTVERRRCQHVA
jgi:hypothetical protein